MSEIKFMLHPLFWLTISFFNSSLIFNNLLTIFIFSSSEANFFHIPFQPRISEKIKYPLNRLTFKLEALLDNLASLIKSFNMGGIFCNFSISFIKEVNFFVTFSKSLSDSERRYKERMSLNLS